MSQDFYTLTATIPANESVSGAVDLGGSRIVAIQAPSAWTAADIHLLTSRCPDIDNLLEERAADILADADAAYWTSLIGTETVTVGNDDPRAALVQKCLSVHTPGGVVNEGVYSPPVYVHRSTDYVGSCYLKQSGATGATIEITLAWYTVADAFISETAVPVVTTLTGSWQRAHVHETSPATACYAKLRVRTESAPAAAQHITFYLDNVQIEQAAAETTFKPLADQQGQGSGTWARVSDSTGTLLTLTGFSVDDVVWLSPHITAGWRYIRVKSSAAQAAARTVTLIARPV